MGMMEKFDQGRAAVLAREYLIFRLAEEEYAIDILKVQEIRGYDSVTRIIGAPDYLKGVINLRGAIVPILDLRLKFQLAEARYDGFTVVVILNVGGRVVGAVVDSVSDVVDLAPSQIRPAPEVGSDPEGNFVAGLGTIASGEQQRMLVLIDIERLMAATELARFTAVA